MVDWFGSNGSENAPTFTIRAAGATRKGRNDRDSGKRIVASFAPRPVPSEALELAMPYLQLPDGLPLYYEDHGAGKPILLLPGWTVTTGFWQRQIADLSRDHRVLTFDLRGAG